MNIYKILQKKRDKLELTQEEISFFVQSTIDGNISREQIAALLMAICINGMSEGETFALTQAMLYSGAQLDFRYIGKPVADKHSTGGVGDKISLILLPILLSFDVVVPMISGRGLGHTGGTIDKLESIIGYKVNLSQEEMKHQMETIGGMIVAQSEDIAPADRIIYSIRDITATVESDTLITASILSKKLAEGLDALVLDLKIGSGAFYQTFEQAKNLVRLMEAVCSNFGVRFQAIPTNMNNPLGNYVGNWLEVVEVQNCLRGDFPEDLKVITFELASELLVMCNIFENKIIAINEIENVLASGRAYDNFLRWIASQGGNIPLSEKEYANTPIYIVSSERDAKIKGFQTKEIGYAAIELGAGRKVANDQIDFAAGIKLLKKNGDSCVKEEPIAVLFARDKAKFETAEKMFKNAIIWEN
ncbi:MAG: thymidine phosphorylase [Ignavibacteria bacterium]|nr:thymidine phosphorylase [Ignavibacteria bacterium]